MPDGIIYRTERKRVEILPFHYPTIFPKYPQHLNNHNKTTRKPPRDRNCVEPLSSKEPLELPEIESGYILHNNENLMVNDEVCE